MSEQNSWNIEECLKCSAWTGTGCSLTVCSILRTYIYINGKRVEI